MGSSPALRRALRKTPGKWKQASFELRLSIFCTLLALPGLLITGVLIFQRPWTAESKMLLLGAELVACFMIGAALRNHIVHPLQTLANVVGALREEDYSLRARRAVASDSLGELSLEVNALADLLAQQQTGTLEAAALLQHVVEEVDVPILAFDPEHRLKLVNSAGERLLQQSSKQLLGKLASEIKLEETLSCENESLISLPFVAGARWVVRRSPFRQQGVPHVLVVLSDVSRALREEERRAWQRLIRVIGHELNNSLAPIKSIAGSLSTRLSTASLRSDERQDFERGLNIIEQRAASLNRFLQAYRQLAQMPPPVLKTCSMSAIAKRVAALETRIPVAIVPGPDVTLMVDPDQLEQMLINLLRNAAEAAIESHSGEGSNGAKPHTEPKVELTWKLAGEDLVLNIHDNGPGLMNPSNVFVPFYTTKPKGSGIGLLLSRQVAEAHGGSLELSNRIGEQGCTVTVTLPVNL
ncbi:MAG TPA: ATP-binding protein [Terriglobales bacterium]|nr:ATP-binding protein [Terriglobales bacterium]